MPISVSSTCPRPLLRVILSARRRLCLHLARLPSQSFGRLKLGLKISWPMLFGNTHGPLTALTRQSERDLTGWLPSLKDNVSRQTQNGPRISWLHVSTLSSSSPANLLARPQTSSGHSMSTEDQSSETPRHTKKTHVTLWPRWTRKSLQSALLSCRGSALAAIQPSSTLRTCIIRHTSSTRRSELQWSKTISRSYRRRIWTFCQKQISLALRVFGLLWAGAGFSLDTFPFLR
mmetsp:Transcript_96203/g.200966  ORF Transcript_96203/g.200966 Transcript_96203/m.200966 type:complete len:232 (-) Transcript_96203:82-777(-)